MLLDSGGGVAGWISVGLFTLAQHARVFFPGMGVDHPIPNFFCCCYFHSYQFLVGHQSESVTKSYL